MVLTLSRHQLVSLLAGSFLALSPAVHAAKNPLSPVPVTMADGHSPGIKAETCTEGGEDFGSIHDGDFVFFKGYDFDSGVAGFQARLASSRASTIEIHLDSAGGPLIGKLPVPNTGGWQNWENVSCTVDNTQAGVRDVYLVFRGAPRVALVNLESIVFLKTIVTTGITPPDLSGRLDRADDGEPQATHAWGMPENGFTDDFRDGLAHWTAAGFKSGAAALDGSSGILADGGANAFAYTPNVYINKTDTGGEWRTMAEASLSADVIASGSDSRPGLGFTSTDGRRSIYVTLDPQGGCLEAWRKLGDGPALLIRRHPKLPTDRLPQTDLPGPWTVTAGQKYRMKLDWSPYSNALLVFLYDSKGATVTSFRTVIDLPAARRPLLVNSGGPSAFGNVKFDPKLDSWEFHWEWKKEPVLTPDVCNPAVWRGPDGRFYMMWRKFGADTYHGIASSADGVHWDRVTDQAIKCTGDMNVVVDPFGDGKWYVTPGGDNAPWWTCDGADQFRHWTQSPLKLGSIYGNCRIQEIIDTKRYPQLAPISLGGANFRFIAYTEDWGRMPTPHTVVLLSNNLTSWVLANPDPVIPPSELFWGEKGNAIGSAYPLPDGNILIASCSCTHEGYTGAPEPSNVSAIADGRRPWKIQRLGTLPDAPVSRENVWYEGPNFGTAFIYDPKSDTLFFYGGFHDYNIGMMRIRHFLGKGK